MCSCYKPPSEEALLQAHSIDLALRLYQDSHNRTKGRKVILRIKKAAIALGQGNQKQK